MYSGKKKIQKRIFRRKKIPAVIVMTRLYLQAAILLLRQQQWPQPPWPQPKRRNKGWQESLGLSLRSLYQLKSPFIKTRKTSLFFFPNLLTNAKLDERHISKSYIGR